MAYLGLSYTAYGSGVTYDAGELASAGPAAISGAVGGGTATITNLDGTTSTVSTVVYTTSSAHGFNVGQIVSIAGITGGTNASNFNLSNQVIRSVTTSSPFTFTVYNSATGTYTSSGGVAFGLWSSKINGNVGNGTPAAGNYWGTYAPAYAWTYPSSNNYTLITDSLKTETHDLFVGSVFHNVGTTGTQAQLFIEQSPDNKNWDVTSGSTYVPVYNTGMSFSVAIVSPFIRLKFVANNSTAIPTTFRLNGKTSDSGVKY
jgi:hypothetical protein